MPSVVLVKSLADVVHQHTHKETHSCMLYVFKMMSCGCFMFSMLLLYA